MDTLKDKLPVLSALLIIISLTRLILYYNYFGINILSYIDFSEALALSAPVFISLGLFIIVINLLVILFRNPNKKSIGSQVDLSNTTLRQRAIYFTNSAIFLMITIFSPILLIFVIFTSFYKNDLSFIDYSLFIQFQAIYWILDDFIVYEAYKNLKNTSLGSSQLKIRLYYTAFGVLFSILSYTRISAYRIVHGAFEKQPQVSFTFANRPYRTDQDYRYIGRTKSYLFFYNTKTKYAEVFVLSEIKFFALKDNDFNLSVID